MITKNDMQLKSIMKKKAEKYGISPQATLQLYCLERLLERMSKSEENDFFIIKGGFLIASLIGIGNRSTMDIDTTVKGFTVSKEKVKDIFSNICNINIDDQLTFTLDRVEDIRETDDYPGIRVFILCEYGKIKSNLTVDVTTGDSIIPSEIEYTYKCVFDDKDIPIWAYPLENIMAEKLETVIARNIANTRPRDFYDIYILYKLKGNYINWQDLKKALISTSKKRKSLEILKNYSEIIDTLKINSFQNNLWNKFIKKNSFATGISFEQTVEIVSKCFINIEMVI